MIRLLFWANLVYLLAGTTAISQPGNDQCITCHGDVELFSPNATEGDILEYVAEGALEGSVHEGAECIDCHANLEAVDEFPHDEKLPPVDCSLCHDEVSDIFRQSLHGKSEYNGLTPTCASCHGTHNILSAENSESMVSAENLPSTCASCHLELVISDDPDVHVANTLDRYLRGTHVKSLARGIASAASCNDCHGVHDLRKATDPLSRVNKANIPQTCAVCHNEIYEKYSRGIHGKALEAGIHDSPNCSDCHGEHEILQIDDPDSPVNASNLSDYVCGKCHNDPKMTQKYGLSEDVFTSYQDSYHGLALKGGLVKAANCVSCHNAHDILPQQNPASSIHIDNRTATCQKCHPKANDAFAVSYSHSPEAPEFDTANNIVRMLYIVLIIVVIAGMLIHNLIIMAHFIIEKKRRLKGVPKIRRFTGNMVYQHLVLLITFSILVVTGFALRYPDAWFVSVMNFFGIFESARSIIHRISAVLLIYISLHHVVFLMFSRRGHRELRSFWPKLSDFSNALVNMKYHLGVSKTKPCFDRYDYTEKAEYWAVIWGTLVMVITGFVLWFPETFTSFMPPWVVKISETIHFYEAWLATLAIGVFHLFFVIFHPKQYPMTLTWLTGNMTREEVKEHHPLWYEKIVAEEESERAKESAKNTEIGPIE